ncbi:hypothetical protein Tsubulata_012209 [Turnera subulata]|uniref:HMG box domain-containing protein n=1 Tax=Turnera subulata TaxID=218843 RepID=A0A9Q0FKH5_9ROSI|nr:hypothetical protein Tsubulata_012209 [Turnera subulata]
MAPKRVDAQSTSAAKTMLRARDGSAFTRCDSCNQNVPVAAIDFHDCEEARERMKCVAQLVARPAPAKKSTERKRASTTEPKGNKAKKEKKANEPKARKRPPTAFFLFLDDFRKSFKEANPDSKGVKQVAKEGGEQWRSMTDEEKKPYVDRADELKAEYKKALETDNAENEDDEAGSEEETEEKEEGGSEKEETEEKEEENEEAEQKEEASDEE